MLIRRHILGWAGLAVAPIAGGQSVMRASTLLEADPATTIASRVMGEAYRRLGLALQVLSMPGERALISANSGVTDAELYRKAGLEQTYTNLVMVPVPLLKYEIVAFTKLAFPPVIRGWESLKPYRLGYVKGIKVIEEHTGGMQVDVVATMQQAFSMLELNRTDLVLGNRLSGLAALRALRLNGVQVLAPALASFPVFHYVHRRHARWVEPLTAALRDLERERWIARVQDEVVGTL